jgi:iron complex outermembrane receptor protein
MRSFHYIASATLLSSVSQIAMAQDVEQENETSSGVAEILVTAQKRAESIQDVPISVVALDADTLEQRGINSLGDLFTGQVPSLRIAPFLGRPSAVSIGMRGLVPVDATQVTRDPTVGIYIDGVYLGRVSGLAMEFSEVERLEVLRGPQGTLFGRNTIGGAISVQ